jgi:hypothetical protein
MGCGAENEEGSAMGRAGFIGWFGANCAFSLAKVGCSRGCGKILIAADTSTSYITTVGRVP